MDIYTYIPVSNTICISILNNTYHFKGCSFRVTFQNLPSSKYYLISTNLSSIMKSNRESVCIALNKTCSRFKIIACKCVCGNHCCQHYRVQGHVRTVLTVTQTISTSELHMCTYLHTPYCALSLSTHLSFPTQFLPQESLSQV